MKTAHLTAHQAVQLERQEQALRWRMDERLTFNQIAERFGVSEPTALTYVNKALARRSDKVIHLASKYRGIQAYRLENALHAHELKALAGDVKSTEVYLKVLDQLNRLYGLYPTTDNSSNGSQVSINVTYTNDNRQITITQPVTTDTAVPGDTPNMLVQYTADSTLLPGSTLGDDTDTDMLGDTDTDAE